MKQRPEVVFSCDHCDHTTATTDHATEEKYATRYASAKAEMLAHEELHQRLDVAPNDAPKGKKP